MFPHRSARATSNPLTRSSRRSTASGSRTSATWSRLLARLEGEIHHDQLRRPHSETIVFNHQEALKATDEILSDNGIRQQASDDLARSGRRLHDPFDRVGGDTLRRCRGKPVPLAAGQNQEQQSTRDASRKDLEKLQGTWIQVRMEADGENTPPEHFEGWHAVYHGDSLTLKAGETVRRRGIVTVDASRTPKAINTWDLDGPYSDQTVPGIYALEGDTLKLCSQPPARIGRPSSPRPRGPASSSSSTSARSLDGPMYHYR